MPFEDQAATNDGAVNVIYGGLGGLAVPGNEVWSQGGEGVAGAPEAGDLFGYSLAAGNFGNSSQADLAIGVPFEDQAATNDGAVNVIYGGLRWPRRCRATRCGARAARASPAHPRPATSSERPSRRDGPDLGGEGRRPARAASLDCRSAYVRGRLQYGVLTNQA